MKFTLLAATAVIGLATVGARAEEQYPTPITRPIYSSVAVQDVGGGGPWSTKTVITGGASYARDTGSEAMPVGQPMIRAPSAYVEHGVTTGSHG